VIDWIQGIKKDYILGEDDKRRTVGDNTHVTDIGGFVHEGPYLICESKKGELDVGIEVR
jgi:hypothetical protein